MWFDSSVTASISTVMVIDILREIIDIISKGNMMQEIRYIILKIIIVICVGIVSNYMLVYELKLKLYEKLLNMNMYFFNDTHSADAIKTLNWDANSLKDSWFSHIYWVLGKIVIVVEAVIHLYEEDSKKRK